MAWHTYDGAANTYNRTMTSGSECIYMLKELLKEAGWTVLSSSDGSGYAPSSDMITHAGIGANGMDNNTAWFRIEDPTGTREYAMQRQATSYTWIMKYSRVAGFITGGGAGTVPTASDEVGLAKGSTSSQTVFATSGTWRVHAAAQDAAVNGVYAWWLMVYHSTSAIEDTFMLCEPLNVESFGSDADNDPLVHYVYDAPPALANLTNQTTAYTRGYMMHGLVGEEYDVLTALSYRFNSANAWPGGTAALTDNPHTSAPVILPVHFFRYYTAANTAGYKGISTNFMWIPSGTYGYQDIFKVGTNDYYVAFNDIAMRGWPTSTLPVT